MVQRRRAASTKEAQGIVKARGPDEQPLVVYGRGSHEYDFGPQHPFTPRRFGPGIDLLRELGATRFVEPAAASDADLARVHSAAFIATVRMLSDYPEAGAEAGFDHADTPPFYDMHRAASLVAGGTLAAMDRILTGEVAHAFHPGGGLHHASRDRASGFCIYNDLALAIARARDAGHRVLYVDVDAHHGDGVEMIFWHEPGVLTVSVHETGLVLFPGTGFVEGRGGEGAEGSAINIPLQPGTGDRSWLEVLELVVPAAAAVFRPTMLVTLNGSDAYVHDPLTHLRVTTGAMGRVARMLDGIAHEFAGGRWLATGGGGYDIFRAVPRSWALTWLAQAHAPVPPALPPAWLERWAADAARARMAPLPATYEDSAELVAPEPAAIRESNLSSARAALSHTLHLLADVRRA